MQFTDLEHIDIEILKYIAKHQPISKSIVLKNFPEEKYSTEYRINTLMNGYISEEKETKDSSGRRIIVVNRPLGIYTLNKDGNRFFQDLKKLNL
ncbi:hypothetical protein [Sebaldella sp. S0638]|uniref:hypothetical protein n=1 Tax=Sebaldella sp. S0638 TaxID=2957809 RepID=UPI00209F973C|nr:hypothetical protein [Sebaldella sp. S0638]MCP1226527.1 hypothetical protein [Sebaldella sp. S0638]